MGSWSTIAALLVAAVCVVPAPAPAQELLQDSKLGFKLKAPTGFEKVPLKNDEEWIVARWISTRSYYAQDKQGFTTDQKTELCVIAFPAEKGKDKVDGEKSGAGDPSKTTTLIKNPYKDYQRYLKETLHEGAYCVAADDKAEVEGIQVETLDIKVEKDVFVPKKILTWIFKCDDAQFAVQFEMVEPAYPKLKNEILACMRSFRRIAKDAGAGSAPNSRPSTENTADLTPAQRAARRREQETQAQEKFTKGLTEGWTGKKYGRVLILNHVDEKYASTTAENANAILDYLDSNLGYFGPGEYVRAPVIRICRDFDEEHLYDKGGSAPTAAVVVAGDSFPEFVWDREITTHKNTYTIGSQWGDYALRSVCIHWFCEHDEQAFRRTPYWLISGVMSVFKMSRTKGGKLDFFNDSDERVAISQAVHAGKLTKLQDLVKMERTAIDSNRSLEYECATAARFFLTGPKKAKDALQSYLVAVAKISRREVDASRPAGKSDGEAKPKKGEEEDAKSKEQNSRKGSPEKARLEEAFKAAFGTWTEADWKSFESLYAKSLN